MAPERPIAAALGVDEVVARELLVVARERMGPRRLRVHLLAFATATGPVGRVLPAPVRHRAVAGLVGCMLREVDEMLRYIGLTPAGHHGLLRG